MAPQRAGRDITKQMLRHRQMVLDQMEFKQKAEEKKMSMSKNIARLAVTAGLTAALSFGGVMAPVTMAFAEGGTGSITIKKVDDANKDNTFKAYQIFKAKVVDENGKGKVASDIKWANDAIGSKVITAIKGSAEYQELVKKDSAKELKDNASASVVAEWLSQNVNATPSTASSSNGTRVAPGSVLYEIAAAVSGKTVGVTAENQAGASFNADESWTRPDANGDGYYLFVSDGLTDPAKSNAGTSPIFAIVGGNPVTVTEKTSIPTVDKEVKEGDTWGNVSDSQIGEEIEYRLTGSVADNIDTFTTYTYEFHDHLSVGLEAIQSSVVVTIDGRSVQSTNNYSVQLTDTKDASNKVTGHDLTISFTDLKAAAKASNVTLTKNSKVVVTYKAKFTSDAEYTVTGNTNEVKLVYSNDPMSNGTGTSTPKKVTDYVFGLDITKVEEGNKDKKLAAGFKVKVVNNGDSASAGKWLKDDGTLVETKENASEFMTDATSGEVFIPGLVAGTYEITETTTPSGYNTIEPFQITVTPTYDENGKLSTLAVSEEVEKVTPGTANGSVMSITIENKKGSGLPLTGLNGVTFTWIAGGAVLCIGVAHLIRSRKQAEESEQE